MLSLHVRATIAVSLIAFACPAIVAAEAVKLTVGGAERLGADVSGAPWTSSDPKVAQVLSNGFVIGLTPGQATVKRGDAEYKVSVVEDNRPIVLPASLKQFLDNRKFEADGRLCYGSELNGRRAVAPEERKNTDSNRVINPKPLRPDHPLEWQVEDATEIYDGAGVLMGTVAADLKVGDRTVASSKFNFGMSKVLGGRLCLYAFSVAIVPTPELKKILDPEDAKRRTVSTSAWLPLDRVVEKEALLERIGVGKVKLPRLPLEEKRFKITGGNPQQYMTPMGELRIVKDPAADPVPSHYLRRPSCTVNIIYSVPGFGLGGQGLDSFLISNGIVFRPAKGAKVFVQPTHFPGKHPQAGKVSPMTMTFIYGAAEVKGVEPVYGWVAREALAPGQ